jgi:hypothetical protein
VGRGGLRCTAAEFRMVDGRSLICTSAIEQG